MKIGFDVAQTCVEKAGCGWYADALIRALVGAAPEHQFLLYHQFGTWINNSTAEGTYIDAPNVAPTFTDVTPEEAARIWSSPEELVVKTGAPDIVHANCYQAPKVPGAKLVYTLHDVSFWAVPEFTTEANRLICQRGVLRALQNADGFVFVSQSSHDEFNRMLPGWLERNQKPWVVTYEGSKFRRTSVPPSGASDYWLAVGSLEPRKNYETLLSAVELYWERSSRRLPLKIAGGTGWKSEQLMQRIETLQAHGMVTYLGYVPEEHLPPLYGGAHALVFPSWYEGFGLPVLEAMTQGCAVICSDRTSLPEVGGNGPLYVDPGNARQIAEVMLHLESDENLRNVRIQDGLLRAATLSWQRTAERTLEFYNRLLDPTNGGA
jgi:glycosyltransferase involved in cell wall biosynthesis